MSNRLKQPKFSSLLAICLLSSLVTGCSTVGNVLNPYESEFSCEAKASGGKCAPVRDVYRSETTGQTAVALRDNTPVSPAISTDHTDEDQPHVQAGQNQAGQLNISMSSSAKAESAYQTARLDKMAKLLKAPATPMVAPPVVIRILILPYEDDENGLNLSRYAYLMVDKPKWVLGDYLEPTYAQ